MQALGDFLREQHRRAEEELHNKFLVTLGLDGKLPIMCEDIDFAMRMTPNQLFALAIAASARARHREIGDKKND